MSSDQLLALVINATLFAGPAAVQALANAGYHVLAQDPLFADLAQFQAFIAVHS